MRRTAARLVASAGLAACSLGGCSNLEVVTASYATLAEARQAGAVARGWVPEGLPAGTTDLREAHDLDSNRRWGLFSFPVGEGAALQEILHSEELPLRGVSCDPPGRLEWWPIVLRGSLDPDAIQATGLRSYRSRDGELIFAVNWSQGRAYYWALEP